jgi:hypothetical protein
MRAKKEDRKMGVEDAFEASAGSLRGFVGQAAAQCHHPHQGQLLAMHQGEPWGASLRGKSEELGKDEGCLCAKAVAVPTSAKRSHSRIRRQTRNLAAKCSTFEQRI